MTSSSPRKRRTTGSSSASLSGLAVLLAGFAGCGGPKEILVTHFDGGHGLSLRYPATWKSQAPEPGTAAQRYFLAPAAPSAGKAGLTVTLVATPLPADVEAYAARYLEGKTVGKTQDEDRRGTRGRSYEFTSKDGATRYALLLLPEGSNAYGLYAQGPAAAFSSHEATVRDILASFALERPATYVEQKNETFEYTLRLPPSWKPARSLSGHGNLMAQFTSPAVAVDGQGAPVHASLTVTIEHLAEGDTLESYHEATRQKLGDAFKLLDHRPLRGGYMDVMMSETPMTISRIKRFYQVANGHGYSLSFEARDDIYDLVAPWFDLIASTFRPEWVKS